MQLYGLLGYPLGHSFSASYFAEKFSREQIDAQYVNFEYSTVEEAMTYLRQQTELIGFNVTIPHKQAVLPYLKGCSAEAEAIGAVNVVRVVPDAVTGTPLLYGDNSDWIGFTESLRPLLRPEVHRKALVLGTGGASKAVVYGLRRLGIEPHYVSRRPQAGMLTYEALTPSILKDYLLIVNCTPSGMYPHTETCPNLPYEALTPDHLLYDLVYNPLETLFMKKGKAAGATVKNGLEMLHLQAEAAWNMWNAKEVK